MFLSGYLECEKSEANKFYLNTEMATALIGMRAMINCIPSLTSATVQKELTKKFKTGDAMEYSAYPGIDFAIAGILEDFYNNTMPVVLRDHPM